MPGGSLVHPSYHDNGTVIIDSWKKKRPNQNEWEVRTENRTKKVWMENLIGTWSYFAPRDVAWRPRESYALKMATEWNYNNASTFSSILGTTGQPFYRVDRASLKNEK